MADDAGFLSRWSRRKVAVREGQALPSDPQPAVQEAARPPALPPGLPAASDPTPPGTPTEAKPEPPPALTLDDVALLTRESDYAAFMAREVAPDVKNAALKKLFTDPHFNVMDGLDTYIDDYGKPDPLPPGMLRQMVQSKLLGLFDDEPEAHADTASNKDTNETTTTAEAVISPPPLPDPPALPHEDPDLQLQPDPAPGRAGTEGCPGEDDGRGPERQH